MKGKLLLGLALTSFISINALALEIKNGKLLSHKVWTTGDIQVVPPKKFSKEDVLKLTDKLKVQGITLDDHFTHTFTAILSSTGTEGQRTPVSGYQISSVFNSSNGTLDFVIFNRICAVTSEKTMECMFSSDRIELDAQGMATSMEAPMIEPLFNKEGTYQTEVSTDIARVEGDFLIMESASSSNGFVSITADTNKKK